MLQRMMRGFDEIRSHRGCQLSRLGEALSQVLGAMEETNAPNVASQVNLVEAAAAAQAERIKAEEVAAALLEAQRLKAEEIAAAVAEAERLKAEEEAAAA